MKKVIILLLLSICTFAFGQRSSTVDKELSYTTSWMAFTGTNNTTHAINAKDSTWTYTILKNSYKPVKYDIYMSLDSISGTKDSVTVIFQAKKWIDDASWVGLDTATWVAGGDTIINFNQTTTAQQYQYFRMYVAGSDNTFIARIAKFFIKFWE